MTTIREQFLLGSAPLFTSRPPDLCPLCGLRVAVDFPDAGRPFPNRGTEPRRISAVDESRLKSVQLEGRAEAASKSEEGPPRRLGFLRASHLTEESDGSSERSIPVVLRAINTLSVPNKFLAVTNRVP
jgi:hypothetical protein